MKENDVKSMFGEIAGRYDAANDALSLGLHRSWRKRAIKLCGANPGDFVLDLACGTGDFAIELKNAVGENGKVVAVDFSPEMLEIAKDKFRKRNLKIASKEQDAMNLNIDELGDEPFDIAVCGFGVRNFPNALRGVSEMARAVKPGGKVLILEFGAPSGVISRAFYNLYAPWALPLIGGLITGAPRAYKYLPDTSAAFPSGADFLDIMRASGSFDSLSATSFSFGLAYCYIGKVK